MGYYFHAIVFESYVLFRDGTGSCEVFWVVLQLRRFGDVICFSLVNVRTQIILEPLTLATSMQY